MSALAELLTKLPHTKGQVPRLALVRKIMMEVEQSILQATESVTRGNALVWSRVDPAEVVALVTERLQNALMLPESEWSSPEHLRNYLFKAARHAAIDCYRQAVAQKRGPPGGSSAGLGQAVDHGPSPEDLAIRREEAHAVRQALSGLTPEERELIQLRLEVGWTFAQIAAHRKETFSATYRRFHAILTKLGISLRHLL